MKGLLTERSIAAILFVMVLITFSLAQNETKKREQLRYAVRSSVGASLSYDFLMKHESKSIAKFSHSE
jgi:hypothetical protein